MKYTRIYVRTYHNNSFYGHNLLDIIAEFHPVIFQYYKKSILMYELIYSPPNL